MGRAIDAKHENIIHQLNVSFDYTLTQDLVSVVVV